MEFASVSSLGSDYKSTTDYKIQKINKENYVQPEFIEIENIYGCDRLQEELLCALDYCANMNKAFVNFHTPTEQDLATAPVSDPFMSESNWSSMKDISSHDEELDKIIDKKELNIPKYPIDEENEYSPIQLEILEKLSRGEGITMEEAVLLSGTIFNDDVSYAHQG